MKQYLLATGLFLTTLVFGQTSTYQGNGKTGFGGPVGTGSLTITDNGTALTFTLIKGSGQLNDLVVFYADFTTGGLSTTAPLLKVANKYERAVSGKRGNNVDSAVLNFPADFTPDAAIVFDKDGGKTFFFPPPGFGSNMVEGNAPVVTPIGNNNSPTYSQSINKSDLNLAAGNVTFKFLGTYISETAFRADEAFGDPFTGFRTSMQPAQGWKPYAVQSYFTYTTIALPVKLVDFKAVKEKLNVQVTWTVSEETNIDQYLVQRSSNGSQFATIGILKANNSSSASNYSFADNAALKGTNFYRLAIVERGRTEFSKVVSIKNTDKNSFIVINNGKNLNIKLSGIDAGTYKLFVMNTSGQLLQSLTLQHDGSDVTKQIDMNGGISKGVYRVTLQGENAQFIKSIIVQ